MVDVAGAGMALVMWRTITLCTVCDSGRRLRRAWEGEGHVRNQMWKVTR